MRVVFLLVWHAICRPRSMTEHQEPSEDVGLLTPPDLAEPPKEEDTQNPPQFRQVSPA